MAIRELRVAGYRSLRGLEVGLSQLGVFTRPNGCGKSNLYRALVLVAAAARGALARPLAEEGGMPSVLGAGERRNGSVRMALGVAWEDWDYELACGLPDQQSGPAEEGAPRSFSTPWSRRNGCAPPAPGRRPVALLERKSIGLLLRGRDGRRVAYPLELLALNEPETPIHADPHEPSARLVVKASERSQILTDPDRHPRPRTCRPHRSGVGLPGLAPREGRRQDRGLPQPREGRVNPALSHVNPR